MKRESNFDLIRILSAFLIILIHCSEKGSATSVLSTFAIPLFVMVSGGFLLNRGIEEYRACYERCFKNIFPEFAFFSLFYIVFNWVIFYFNHDKFISSPSYWTPILKLFSTGGTYYHMWFMYMIVGLYIATPILQRIKYESHKGYCISCYILIIYACVVGYFKTDIPWPTNSILYVGIFMLGGLLKNIRISRTFGLLSLFLTIPTLQLIWFIYSRYDCPYIYGYQSPLTNAVAVLIFCGTSAICIPPSGRITLIAKSTFFIYLLHPFFLRSFFADKFYIPN